MIIEQHLHSAPDIELPPPSTPRVIEIDPDSDAASAPGSWGSPAFLKSARSSYGGTLDTAYDPFAEEDGTVPGKGRKRPRYSLRREEWRILDEPDSPREREGTVDWDQAIEDELDGEQTTEPARGAQPEIEIQPHEAVPMETQVDTAAPVQDQSPFVKPLLEQASSISGRLAQQTDIVPLSSGTSSHFPFGSHLPTDTPQLRPIPSPGLPIPSPIVSTHGNAQEYFSASHTVSGAQTTQTTATGTNCAVDFAQDSQVAMSTTTQQQAIEVPAEQTVFSQSQEDIHRTESPLAVTGNTESSGRMKLFKSPMIMGHSEFDQAGIEVEVENRALDMPAVEDMAHHPEWKGQIQKTREVEQEDLEEEDLKREDFELQDLEQAEFEREELEREDAEEASQSPPEMPREGQAFHLMAKTALQTECPPAHPTIAVTDEQSGEDEPEEFGDHEANPLELTNIAPVARPNPSRSPGYSEDASDVAEGEALSDEKDAPEYTSQDDEEPSEEGEDEDEDEGEFDHDDLGLPEQPRLRPAQPEVIVLDSDSEDELASEHPVATPSQPVRHETGYQESFDQSAASASEDDEQGWSSVDEEPDYDDVDSEDLLEDEERVHDSDLEDESPVDLLGHDGAEKEDSLPGTPMEFENDEGGFAGEESEGSMSEQDMQDDGKVGSAPENAIDLSSDADEPQEAEMAPTYDEDDRLRLAAPASKGLDGSYDRDEAQSHIVPEEDQQGSFGRGALGIQESEVPRWEGTSTAQITTVSLPPTSTSISLKHDLEQLPTPDPTQEAVPGQLATPMAVEQAGSHVLAERRPPSVDLNLASETLTGAAIGTRVLAPGEDDMPPTVPAREAPPEHHSTPQQLDDFIEADVAIPSTDDVPVDEQGKNDRLTGLSVPTVPSSKPPVPDRHAHGLRSKLSYFAPLATLVDHYNALVDTISVVHETTQIAKATSASKDYYVTIQLTDPSMAGTTLQAQIFRRYKSALPSLVDGNVILLRNFKVRSYDHSIMLVSVESSSWAVFDGSSPEAQMNGPPVEYGSEERAYTSGLRRWYGEVGAAMVADNRLQAAVERDSMEREATPSDDASSESGSMVSVPRADSMHSARSSRRSRKSHRRVTIHELRDGTRYTEVGSPNSRESIHELRDGTVYANL